MSKQIMGTSQNEEDRLDEAGIPPIQLHHIGLKTARFEEMRAFYRTFLGVHPVLEIDGFGGFYTFDLAHHRLAIFHDPTCTEQVPTSVGMHHVAFLYSLDDLMRVYQRLKHKDILPFMGTNHSSNTSFYYRDPDNNTLELLVDNYGPDLRKGQEALRAFQTSSNPPVVMINPETYLAAWQAGATLTELHERSYAGEFAEGAPSFSSGGTNAH